MIMCVLLCYPVSIHMSQLQATGRPISSFERSCLPNCFAVYLQNKPVRLSYFLTIFYKMDVSTKIKYLRLQNSRRQHPSH